MSYEQKKSRIRVFVTELYYAHGTTAALGVVPDHGVYIAKIVSSAAVVGRLEAQNCCDK